MDVLGEATAPPVLCFTLLTRVDMYSHQQPEISGEGSGNTWCSHVGLLRLNQSCWQLLLLPSWFSSSQLFQAKLQSLTGEGSQLQAAAWSSTSVQLRLPPSLVLQPVKAWHAMGEMKKNITLNFRARKLQHLPLSQPPTCSFKALLMLMN